MLETDTKACKDCLTAKPRTEFYRAHGNILQPYCKECFKVRSKKYRQDNPNCKANDSSRLTKWALENKAKIKLFAKAWSEKNKDRRNERIRNQRATSPEKFRAWDKRRVRTLERIRTEQARKRRLRQAMPKAFRTKEIRKQIDLIYLNRPDGFHVDHIVPISGKNVSGLHVPWNLQYLPALENQRKQNKLTLTT